MYKKVLFPQQAACLGCVEAHNKNIFYVSSLNREIMLRGWASPYVHLSGLLAYSFNSLYAAFETWLIKSFLLVYGAVKTTINDQGVVWVYGKGH